MKNHLFLIIFIFVCSSCSMPGYILENRVQTTGLDFREGKWLLNEIDVPYSLSDELNKQIFTDFEKNLGNRLVRIRNTKGIILPNKMQFYPNKETLKTLKTGINGYDYFINIKASIKKNQLGEMQFGENQIGQIDIPPQRIITRGIKQAEIIIEIYDLNLLQTVYSQKAIGTINLPQNNGEVNFSTSVYGLIRGGYKRLIKDINNKSIKN